MSVGAAALGRHEDDAVRGAGAVDGGGGVLQDVDALDFLTGKAGELIAAAGNAVDDDERGVVAEGGAAADVHDGIVTARFTGTVVDDDAGHTAGEALGQVDGGVLDQFLTGGRRDRTRQRDLGLGAVADGDGLLQEDVVFPEDEVDDILAVNRGLLFLKAHQGGHEDGIAGGVDAVTALCIGQGTVGGTLHHDEGADKRFALFAGDLAADAMGPALGKSRQDCKKDCQETERMAYSSLCRSACNHKTRFIVNNEFLPLLQEL